MTDNLSRLTDRQRKGWEIINGLGEQMSSSDVRYVVNKIRHNFEMGIYE